MSHAEYSDAGDQVEASDQSEPRGHGHDGMRRDDGDGLDRGAGNVEHRDGDFTGSGETAEEPNRAEIAYQRLRRDYDALVAAVDRLQQHHGLFLLRQAAGTLRRSARPEQKPLADRSPMMPAPTGVAPREKAAREKAQENNNDEAACDQRLRGGAARYYAGILQALLHDLQQRADDLTALAVILPPRISKGAARAPQGPNAAQILSESKRLLKQVENDVQPLLTRALTASKRCPAPGVTNK